MSSRESQGGDTGEDPIDVVDKLVIGIEGGATKTDWVYLEVGRDGKTTLLSNGQLPGANFRIVSGKAISLLLNQLPAEASHIGAFLAGCADEQDRERLTELVRLRWPRATIAAGSDRDSSLATAFKDGDGIVVISGTGSAVTGRRGSRIEKAGGRGRVLGDRGSAYAISVEGLRLALERYDLTRKTTLLAQSILTTLSLSTMQQLENWVQSADKMAIAGLMPLMFAAAEAGDDDMYAIIDAEAATLARYTESVARRLECNSPVVKLQGGVFLNERIYIEMYRNALWEVLPGAIVDVCGESGAMGAAWLAARAVPDASPAVTDPGAAEPPNPELAEATTEQANPRSANIDHMALEELVDLFIDEESFVIDALRTCRTKIQNAIAAVTRALSSGGRLFYVGAGTSGRLGVLDASEIPPTFGQPPDRVQGIIAGGVTALHTSVEGAEDHPLEGSLAIGQRGVTAGDVVMGITASGRTPFVLGALARAREIGAATILLTCNPARSRSDRPWDVEIDLPTGPELITGSTRLKAGTATKLVLNMISTCSMVILGMVTSNLMIDLRPTNTKLRDRAVRLVSELKGLTYEQARATLERYKWNVRRALASTD